MKDPKTAEAHRQPHVVVYGPVAGSWHVTLRDGRQDTEPVPFASEEEALTHGRVTYPDYPVRVLDLDALTLRELADASQGREAGSLTAFHYGDHAGVAPSRPELRPGHGDTPPAAHAERQPEPYSRQTAPLPEGVEKFGMYGVTDSEAGERPEEQKSSRTDPRAGRSA